ncbi:MBL fold metallo-hydrolase [Thermodesulfobacteriota bacterium]
MKTTLLNQYILSAIVLFAPFLNGCSAPYVGSPSDHFNGSSFYNNEPDHTFMDMVKWLIEMKTVPWPKWVDDPEQPKPVEQVKGGDLRVTYINHATILIQMDGLNILTDPIFSFRAGPVSWIGVKRVRDPGIYLEDLPKIDYVLISHDHYDHLDLPSLKTIAERHQPKHLVGLGVKRRLLKNEIHNVEELDWWQTHISTLNDMTFTFVPARHDSGRIPLSKNKTLWGGFVIESPSGQVYFVGDTGYGEFIDAIKNRFKQIRLAIMPIGSYEKRWFMKSQHMNPDDAVLVHKLLGVQQSMGMHFGTFAEHPEQSIDTHEKDLAIALDKYNIPPARFWVLQFGEGRDVAGLINK